MMNVGLAKRRVDDWWFNDWVAWARVTLPPTLSGLSCGELSHVDVSENALGDEGAAALASLLEDLAVPVRVLRLHKNCIGDSGAAAVARWLEHGRGCVAEVHLSHNSIGNAGAAALLRAGALAAGVAKGSQAHGTPGRLAVLPRYPTPGAGGRPTPLWLRIHHNALREPVGRWLAEMTAELVRARRERGYLAAGARAPDMLCEAREGSGCAASWCTQLCPGSAGCPAGGPVLHVPHIRNQSPLKLRSDRVKAQPALLALAAPEEECPIAPAEAQEISPAYPASLCGEALNEADVCPMLAETPPFNARARHQVDLGDLHPEDFLAPLAAGQRVKVLHVEVDEDQGWAFAEATVLRDEACSATAASSGLLRGWVSLLALELVPHVTSTKAGA